MSSLMAFESLLLSAVYWLGLLCPLQVGRTAAGRVTLAPLEGPVDSDLSGNLYKRIQLLEIAHGAVVTSSGKAHVVLSKQAALCSSC